MDILGHHRQKFSQQSQKANVRRVQLLSESQLAGDDRPLSRLQKRHSQEGLRPLGVAVGDDGGDLDENSDGWLQVQDELDKGVFHRIEPLSGEACLQLLHLFPEPALQLERVVDFPGETLLPADKGVQQLCDS